MARQPRYAGSFYPEEGEELKQKIKNCFEHELGPGALPVTKREGKVKAVVVPHAGYDYSGPCAAWAYKKLAEAKPPKVYIMIGPNHSANESAIHLEDWKTPLGFSKTDIDLARKISEKAGIPINDSAHSDEHSIEVQHPFLQFINEELEIKPFVVCMMLSQDIDLEKAMESMSDVLEDIDHTFIISTDFTHYGRNYHFLPFTLDVKQRLEEMDMGAANKIIEKDPNAFIEQVKTSLITMCGYVGVYAFLLALKYEGDSSEGEILRYYTSAQLSGDDKNSVSYVSIMFK